LPVDREKLALAIAERSPLSLSQVERLFGGEVTDDNKAAVAKFLQMSHNQQKSCWGVYCRVHHDAPDFTIDAVR